jgi:hypothetical protein
MKWFITVLFLEHDTTSIEIIYVQDYNAFRIYGVRIQLNCSGFCLPK